MNRINLDWMTSYLDAHGCHYDIQSFSHRLSDQEMTEMTDAQGVALLRTQAVRVDGRVVLLAVKAKSQVDLAKVRDHLGAQTVELLDRNELSEVLPTCPGGVVPPFSEPLGLPLVIDQSLSLARAVKFRVSPTNDFLRMEFSDFRRLFQPQIQSFQASAFRAGVAEVVPKAIGKAWEQAPSCFLGVSLDNANFEGPRLDAVLKWAGKHYRRVCILVADSIHRITLGILDPTLDEASARQKALATGRAFEDTNAGLFQGVQYACQFEVIRCSDLEADPRFPGFRDDLRALFEAHDRFRVSVRSFSEGFIDKKYAVGQLTDPSGRDQAVDRCVAYFLEELALCAVLRLSGDWPVLIYPGSLSVFTDMIEDGFDSDLEVVRLLRSLISLSLNLKGD